MVDADEVAVLVVDDTEVDLLVVAGAEVVAVAVLEGLLEVVEFTAEQVEQVPLISKHRVMGNEMTLSYNMSVPFFSEAQKKQGVHACVLSQYSAPTAHSDED